MTERLTGDYSEILATKSQELAELTKAFNECKRKAALELTAKLRDDFDKLWILAAHSRFGS